MTHENQRPCKNQMEILESLCCILPLCCEDLYLLVCLRSNISLPQTIAYLKLFFHFLYLIIYIVQMSHFSPLTPLHPACPYSHTQSSHHCPCPWVLHLCSLTNPFPFSQSVPIPPLGSYSCQPIPWFHVIFPILLISLFCSLDPSCKWDHMTFHFKLSLQAITTEILWFVAVWREREEKMMGQCDIGEYNKNEQWIKIESVINMKGKWND